MLALIVAVLCTGSPLRAQQPQAFPVDTQRQVVRYIAQLANLHCKETVVQEKLSPNGHVQATERSSYDYLIMMQGDDDGFQLNESRLEFGNVKHKPLPMLVTNGFSTLLLVFHPYYSGAFEFEKLPEEVIDGRTALPVHFKHIRGERSLAALALRSREYPLELQGTAWLDKKSGQVIKIDATLVEDMSDIGLRSLSVHVDYKPVALGAGYGTMALPALATVEVSTPKQHWRNSHAFSEYKVFGAEAEQDPNVKVKADNKTEPAPGVLPDNTTRASKERP